MKRVERLLTDERERIGSITAPDGLEERLRHALARTPDKRKRSRAPKLTVAAMALALLVSTVGYNYEGFAYYGQRILGFDEVMTGTLKELNAAGLGQTVNRHAILQDGTELIVSGVIADANQIILYYALRNPEGINERTQQFFRLSRLTGFWTNSFADWGTTTMNDEQTELVGTVSFESVSPFAKKLTLHFSEQTEDHRVIEGSLTFPYHPDEAIQAQIRQSLKKEIAVDQGTITFGSITATPLSTVIKGTWNVNDLDRIRLPFDGIELIANGKSVLMEGSGFEHSMKGKRFELRYDALPKELESLQLAVREFPGYEKLAEKVSLKLVSPTETISLAGRELWIRDVKTNGKSAEITLATDVDVLLDGVSLETTLGTTELRTTIGQKEKKREDGRILKERTLLFDSTGQPEYLQIQGIHYKKTYDKFVEIPLD
ncbi:DUF4179 domain-containing protein [Paenibacillus sp. GD4]|uniref:DUF4179 domain-containing protein n=1 Tax=Paenibacillus sp. GD4 TaxID=3068890 RepID=UPI0027964205|nr:DUF4179 domain-containing protein [Paenibacillus sp. GD4]MDQ1910824.1 DUF4179 domain-containing protein [Paenibacillus sp. GD4]